MKRVLIVLQGVLIFYLGPSLNLGRLLDLLFYLLGILLFFPILTHVDLFGDYMMVVVVVSVLQVYLKKKSNLKKKNNFKPGRSLFM